MADQPAVQILVIEDEADSQELLNVLLSHSGYAAIIASDAEEAQRILNDSAPSIRLLVVDLHLPGQDGWSFLQHLRQDPNTSDIPAIAVTAYHDSAMRHELLGQGGFNSYMAKPVQPRPFLLEIQTLINRTR